MEIIHVAAELVPVAKVGGLGDVLHGLARAQMALGHSVEVILPKYDTLNLNTIDKLEIVEKEVTVFFDGKVCKNTIWHGVVDKIPTYFIESHDPFVFYNRGKIYGEPDDIERFTYFCLATLAFLSKKKSKPKILHLHDWHAAFIAPLIKEGFPLKGIKTVFTIHNLFYQGICDGKCLAKTGFKPARLKQKDHYSLLKGGILYADHVNTVSPTYADEVLSTALGGNLRTILKQREHTFSGILNGIDYDLWNPEKDPLVPHHYSVNKLNGKQKLKDELRKRFSLALEDVPLVAAITRLVPQKGPELIKAALFRTLEWGGQFVLLGSACDDKTHLHFYNLKKTLDGSKHVHLELAYNEELSHLVFAACDLFLMPSIFEPCGLTQMIAMRYGSVPLVRKTGGLADTVIHDKNGFIFDSPTSEAINEAIDHALNIWFQDQKKWHSLMVNGMKRDFSWKKPAQEYLKIYQGLLSH